MSEAPTPEVPEAFRKAFEENPTPASLPEAESTVDNIPRVRAIKDQILKSLEGKWADRKGGRDYRGFIDDGKAHLAVNQDFKSETLTVIYNQYEDRRRKTTILTFAYNRQGELDKYGFWEKESLHEENKPIELDKLISMIATNYQDGRPVTSWNYDPELGLRTASEIADIIAHKPVTEAKKFGVI